jgi:hypothetical protein
LSPIVHLEAESQAHHDRKESQVRLLQDQNPPVLRFLTFQDLLMTILNSPQQLPLGFKIQGLIQIL